MYEKLRLDIKPSRFGFVVLPYIPQARFDYNHVYKSIKDIIQDFNLNGFDFNGIIDGFYEFERRNNEQ